MIRFWKFLLFWNLTMAAMMAYKGSIHYFIPFITAAYCGYQLDKTKDKESK